MNNIKIFAAIITLLGIFTYYPQYKKISETGDVSAYSKEALCMGLLTTSLWTIYHMISTKDKVVLCSLSVSIMFQLYILTKVCDHEKKKLKNM